MSSKEWAYTNSVVGGIKIDPITSDSLWRKIIFAPNHTMKVERHGDFVLTDADKKKDIHLKDTTLQIMVTDLSVAFWTAPDVDETDVRFLAPTYQVGTNRIVKSFTSKSGSGSGNTPEPKMLAAKQQLDSANFGNVSKFANVEWVEPGKSFIFEGSLYQKNSEGKFVSDDPDEPKVLSLGKTGLFGLGREQMVLVTKDADGVWGPSAMNVVNASNRGLGNYAGISRGRYYNNGWNSSWVQVPYYGYGGNGYYGNNYRYGWGNNYGNGCYGGGLFFGIVFSFGGGNNGCFPQQPQPCHASNLPASSYGGASWFNGYNNAPINFGFISGGGNGYYKSNSVPEPTPAYQEDGFADIAPKELRTSGRSANTNSTPSPGQSVYVEPIVASESRSSGGKVTITDHNSDKVETNTFADNSRKVPPPVKGGDVHVLPITEREIAVSMEVNRGIKEGNTSPEPVIERGADGQIQGVSGRRSTENKDPFAASTPKPEPKPNYGGGTRGGNGDNTTNRGDKEPTTTPPSRDSSRNGTTFGDSQNGGAHGGGRQDDTASRGYKEPVMQPTPATTPQPKPNYGGGTRGRNGNTGGRGYKNPTTTTLPSTGPSSNGTTFSGSRSGGGGRSGNTGSSSAAPTRTRSSGGAMRSVPTRNAGGSKKGR